MMSRSRKPQPGVPVEDCVGVARGIAARLAEIEHPVHSLAGSAGALLLFDVLAGEAPPIAPATLARWEAGVVASIETEVASFPDGMLGSAWLLAVRGGRRHAALLRSIDEAVLDALADRAWPGALGIDHGGLAGFALYGLARKVRGRAILDRCVRHLQQLATEHHRWLPGLAALPSGRDSIRLLNMEGAAAAIAVLAAATPSVPRARALVRAGVRRLSSDLELSSNAGIGEWTASPALGIVHGTATWSLGGAGVAAALATAAPLGRSEADAALRFARGLANVAPELCKTTDASLATGTAGLAIVLDAHAERTRDPVLRCAADYWFLRTLRCQRDGRYHYVGTGTSWTARTGVFDGAAGTALALLVAAGHRHARVCRTLLGVA